MAAAREGAALSPTLVCVAYFLLFFNVGVALPYLPLWLRHLGWSGWEIGIVGGVQPVLRWLSAIGYAYVADRWHVRHRLLVATAVASTLALGPLLVAREFWVVMLVMAVFSVLHGPIVPMVDASVMDHLPALGGDYGRLRLWGSIGFIVGAWGSAPLVDRLSPAILPVLLVVSCVPLAPSVARLPRVQHRAVARFQAPWRLLTPPLAVFLAAGFLLQMSCGAWGGLFALHTRSLGFADTVPGFTYGLAVVVEVVMLYWGRSLLTRVPPAWMLVLVLVINVGRWAATAVATWEPVVVGLQLGHVFSFTAFHLVGIALLSRLVPAENSTGGQALYGLVAFGLGGSIGQSVAGVLVDRLGTAGVFWVEAAIAAAGVPLALWLVRLVPRRAPAHGAAVHGPR